MKELIQYITPIILTWAFRSLADYLVAKSKLTANTTDDLLANNFKKLINTITFKNKK